MPKTIPCEMFRPNKETIRDFFFFYKKQLNKKSLKEEEKGRKSSPKNCCMLDGPMDPW